MQFVMIQYLLAKFNSLLDREEAVIERFYEKHSNVHRYICCDNTNSAKHGRTSCTSTKDNI